MAYCKNCGAEIDNQAVICPKCGVPQANKPVEPDDGGFLWSLLGFCIPVVGLILFLVWKSSRPNTSKAAGMGALIAVICVAVFYILMFVIGIGAAMY